MKLRMWREGDLAVMPDPKESTPETYAVAGTTVTLLNDFGVPVMMIGCIELWEGCHEVWAIPTDAARGSSLHIVRLARMLLKVHAKNRGIHRYQTVMNPGNPEYIKWIRLIGFHHECTFKKAYSDGSERHVYVKFFIGGDDGKQEIKGPKSRLQKHVEDILRMGARARFPSDS